MPSAMNKPLLRVTTTLPFDEKNAVAMSRIMNTPVSTSNQATKRSNLLMKVN